MIENYGSIRFLVLFNSKTYNSIHDKIRYLISEKSGIISHNFARMRIDSYNSLPIGKTLSFHNVIIVIKSVVNKNKNNYYNNMFLKEGSCLCKDISNIQDF